MATKQIVEAVNQIFSVVYHPTRNLIAYGGKEIGLTFMDFESGGEPVVKTERAWISDIHFSPDGSEVAALVWNQIAILNLATGKVRYLPPRVLDRSADLCGLVWSPDGNTIATIDFKRTLRLWNVTGSGIQSMQIFAWAICFCFVNETQFVTGADELILWNTKGEQLCSVKPKSQVREMIYDPAQNILITGGWQGYLQWWTIDQGQFNLVRTISRFHPSECVMGIDIKDDRIAFAIGDRLEINHLHSLGDSQGQVVTFKNWLRAVSFSPDRRKVAVACDDYCLYLVDVE